MEIFEHWWEYFKVFYWCIAPRAVDQLINNSVSFAELEKEHKLEAGKILKAAKEDRDFLLALIDKGVSSEEERRKVIEEKASSMISQTGLAVTLIVVSLSLVSLGVEELLPKAAILILLCFAGVNLIVAGLHARHVVSLKYSYPRHDFTSYLGTDQPSVDYIISQLFIIQKLSQINNVKAEFLRYSHWFYKATFVTLFLITLSAPVLLLTSFPSNRNSSPKVVNIGSNNPEGITTRNSFYGTKDTTEGIQSRPKVDSLEYRRNKTTGKAR